MKLLILFAIFVYAQCRPELPPINVIKEEYNKVMLKALKRKFGDSYTGSADDACSLACAKPPPPGFGQHLMNFREPSADAMKAIYNKDFLTKVCAYANETATCVKACPDTQRRAYLRELFAPIKYVCVDSHIVQNADCLRQALEEVGPSCLTGQCAAKKAAAEQSFNAYKTATAGSMDLADQSASTKPVVEDFVGKACDLVKCGVTCGDAVRTQKCGAEANQEVHNFYKELAKSLDAVRYLSPRSYVIDVPQQCKAQ
jgi:hypothetical protein